MFWPWWLVGLSFSRFSLLRCICRMTMTLMSKTLSDLTFSLSSRNRISYFQPYTYYSLYGSGKFNLLVVFLWRKRIWFAYYLVEKKNQTRKYITTQKYTIQNSDKVVSKVLCIVQIKLSEGNISMIFPVSLLYIT